MQNMKRIILLAAVLASLFAGAYLYETAPATARVAGIAGFRTDLATAFQNNFTAAQRASVANSFVSAYQGEFNSLLAANAITNNAAGRGQFAVNKVIDYVQDVHRSEQHKASLQAVVTPTPLPDN